MSYLSLYRKWRPGSFQEVLGQAHVTETLTGALRDDRVAHAYLFSGPRGTGKTSTARILAKSLNCEEGISPTPCGKCTRCREITEGSSLDVFEMDAASHTSVDDVREIRERIPFASAGGSHKVYIIDEAHQLSTPAFNALLKMLEEPPPHVVFVLCTTEAHKLPATVISRCQRFEFRRHSADLVSDYLARVGTEEGIDAHPDALALIARHAHGSLRDALSLLDQAAGTNDGKVDRSTILEILGDAPEDVLLEIAEAIGSGDVPEVFRRIETMVAQGWDPRQLLRQLMEEFRALYLVARGAPELVEVDEEHRERLGAVAGVFAPTHLEWVLRALGDAQADMRLTTHPRLTLEVALARAACLEAGGDDTLMVRLERLERAVLRQGDAAAAPANRTPEQPARPPATAPAATSGQPLAGMQAAAPSAASGEQPAETESPATASPPDAESAPEAAATPQTPNEREAEPPVAGGLADRWETFLEAVKRRKRTTHALIKEGWPVSLTDGVITVGFERPFHAEAIHKPSDTAHITAALEETFGEKLRVRSEIMTRNEPPPAPAAAEDENVSPVDLVMKGFGAEIVDEPDGS